MPAACLPPTGVDNWTIMLLVVLAGILLAAGIVAVAKSKGRVALAIVPLLLLGAVFAPPPAPAQAVAAAIPGFTVDEHWDYDNSGPNDVWQFSEPLTPQQLEILDQLQDLENATVTRTIVLTNQSAPFQSASLPPDAQEPTGDAPAVLVSAVDPYIDEWESIDLVLTVTLTVDYKDDCGKPLQTVVIWTGFLGFVR